MRASDIFIEVIGERRRGGSNAVRGLDVALADDVVAAVGDVRVVDGRRYRVAHCSNGVATLEAMQ